MSQQPNTPSPLYAPAVLDFVTVATEFCRRVETCGETEREQFGDILRPLLAMIYLKASLLPEVEAPAGFNEASVTEADYDFVRHNVAAVLGEQDDYLDVFVEDFKYSDQPVLCTVSEDLADVYQALRNMVEVYRGGHEEAMAVALADVREQFALYWGQKLLNALRALHDARYGGEQHND